MVLYRLLSGFVLTIISICIYIYMNCICHCILIGVIYTPFIKKNRLKPIVCRVPGPGHTANMSFFAVHRDRAHVKAATVCRVQGPGHTANRLCLPCAWARAHGKQAVQRGFLRCTLFYRGPRNAHGKVFAVCPKCSSRQTSSLPAVVCRELFAVCYTRQSVCRV